jgi:hypothetical protein
MRVTEEPSLLTWMEVTSRTELKDGRYWAATGRPRRTRAIRRGFTKGFKDLGMR